MKIVSPTNNYAGTLLLVQLFPQVFQLIFKLLARIFGVENYDLLIGTRGSISLPDGVHQVLRDRFEFGSALLLDLLGELS